MEQTLEEKNNFKIPDWAGKPPSGLHLDVLKDGKLIQKLMIDEKNCYFFGRNRQQCDFPVDHSSASRVHAALVWHAGLKRAYLIDLASLHGTFLGRIKLEPHTPQQVPIDSRIHFGASTRIYVVRERPHSLLDINLGDKSGAHNESFGSNYSALQMLGPGGQIQAQFLPKDEEELENLTKFNTAHNERVTNQQHPPTQQQSQQQKQKKEEDTAKKARRLARKRRITAQCGGGDVDEEFEGGGDSGFYGVHFSDLEEIINMEDVDPSVGRFRNLVQETFVPIGQKLESAAPPNSAVTSSLTASGSAFSSNSCSDTAASSLPPSFAAESRHHFSSSTSTATTESGTYTSFQHQHHHHHHHPAHFSLAVKLGLPMPNLAADVSANDNEARPTAAAVTNQQRLIGQSTFQSSRDWSLSSSVSAATSKQQKQRITMQNDHYLDDDNDQSTGTVTVQAMEESTSEESGSSKKKKYAKEAWPGKRMASSAASSSTAPAGPARYVGPSRS